MSLKFLKPINNSSRGSVILDKSHLSKVKPQKSLLKSLSATGGRNNAGRITVRHIGGAHKKKYRMLDFKRSKTAVEGVIKTIEYDPYRSAHISYVEYDDKEKSYILTPDAIEIGSRICSGDSVDIIVGNALPLSSIPMGTLVHNVEMKPGKGGQIARSAGCYAQVVGRDGDYILLKLRSGILRRILSKCYVTIGVVSNANNKNIKLGKAGRNRWRGVRPTVRGVAMNPVDHPLGGGEGKTSGGRHPVSPWGLLSKGKKTRKLNKSSNKYIK